MIIKINPPQKAAINGNLIIFSFILIIPLIIAISISLTGGIHNIPVFFGSINSFLHGGGKATLHLFILVYIIAFISFVYYSIKKFKQRKKKTELLFDTGGVAIEGEKEAFFPYKNTSLSLDIKIVTARTSRGNSIDLIKDQELTFNNGDKSLCLTHFGGLSFAYKIISVGKSFDNFKYKVSGVEGDKMKEVEEKIAYCEKTGRGLYFSKMQLITFFTFSLLLAFLGAVSVIFAMDDAGKLFISIAILLFSASAIIVGMVIRDLKIRFTHRK